MINGEEIKKTLWGSIKDNLFKKVLNNYLIQHTLFINILNEKNNPNNPNDVKISKLLTDEIENVPKNMSLKKQEEIVFQKFLFNLKKDLKMDVVETGKKDDSFSLNNIMTNIAVKSNLIDGKLSQAKIKAEEIINKFKITGKVIPEDIVIVREYFDLYRNSLGMREVGPLKKITNVGNYNYEIFLGDFIDYLLKTQGVENNISSVVAVSNDKTLDEYGMKNEYDKFLNIVINNILKNGLSNNKKNIIAQTIDNIIELKLKDNKENSKEKQFIVAENKKNDFTDDDLNNQKTEQLNKKIDFMNKNYDFLFYKYFIICLQYYIDDKQNFLSSTDGSFDKNFFDNQTYPDNKTFVKINKNFNKFFMKPNGKNNNFKVVIDYLKIVLDIYNKENEELSRKYTQSNINLHDKRRELMKNFYIKSKNGFNGKFSDNEISRITNLKNIIPSSEDFETNNKILKQYIYFLIYYIKEIIDSKKSGGGSRKIIKGGGEISEQEIGIIIKGLNLKKEVIEDILLKQFDNITNQIVSSEDFKKNLTDKFTQNIEEHLKTILLQITTEFHLREHLLYSYLTQDNNDGVASTLRDGISKTLRKMNQNPNMNQNEIIKSVLNSFHNYNPVGPPFTQNTQNKTKGGNKNTTFKNYRCSRKTKKKYPKKIK